MNIFKMQCEFLIAGNVKLEDNTKEDLRLPIALIKEEFEEFTDDFDIFGEDISTLKECIDLIYTCCQFMNQAIGPEESMKLFKAVHKNNMDKCVDGKLIKNSMGKILKPKGFDREGWFKYYEEDKCSHTNRKL